MWEFTGSLNNLSIIANGHTYNASVVSMYMYHRPTSWSMHMKCAIDMTKPTITIIAEHSMDKCPHTMTMLWTLSFLMGGWLWKRTFPLVCSWQTVYVTYTFYILHVEEDVFTRSLSSSLCSAQCAHASHHTRLCAQAKKIHKAHSNLLSTQNRRDMQTTSKKMAFVEMQGAHNNGEMIQSH